MKKLVSDTNYSRRGKAVAWGLACMLVVIALFVALHWGRALDVWYWVRTGYDFEWMPVGVYPFGRIPMNESGQVAVDIDTSGTNPGRTEAGLWSPGDTGPQPLGTLPRLELYSNASAINDGGSIVGTTSLPVLRNLHMFYWSPVSGMIEIPGLAEGSKFAAAINARDQVVGTSPMNRTQRAFVWDQGSGTRALEVPDGSQETYAVDINDQGWIAGNNKNSTGEIHPVLWKPDAPVRDLGLPSGYYKAYASDLNERGQVLVTLVRAAAAKGKAQETPFIWSEEKGYAAVPLPDGYEDVMAMALDDFGHVLLSGWRAGTREYAGFLVIDGQIRPLPPSRLGPSTRYIGLNNKGWLTGFVEPEGGSGKGPWDRRGFVARP